MSKFEKSMSEIFDILDNAVILNKYDLVELKNRYNDVLMPVVELIDLKM